MALIRLTLLTAGIPAPELLMAPTAPRQARVQTPLMLVTGWIPEATSGDGSSFGAFRGSFHAFQTSAVRVITRTPMLPRM